MLQKKSKGSLIPQLALKSNEKKKHSIDEVLQPVEKKSKKRKSEQNRTDDGDVQPVAGNLCDESRETPEGQKSTKGTDAVEGAERDNRRKKKKKNVTEDIIAEQANADKNYDKSSETLEKPPPGKKERKPKTTESNKSAKANAVTTAEGNEDESNKKKKKKQRKKKKKKTPVITPKDQDLMSEKCTSYLKEWKENRSAWKFQKLFQIWLIQNMLDDSRVPEDIFPVFLEYISGAKGQTVKIINENATKVIEEAEKNESDIDDPKLVRARNIIQAIVID